MFHSGAVLVSVAYFFPWLTKGSMSVSGFQLSLLGYPFLFTLPLLGVSAVFLRFTNSDYRPLPYLILSVAGYLFLWMLIAMVLNYDESVLSFKYSKQAQGYLEFSDGSKTWIIDSMNSIASGYYLTVLGLTAIYLSPFGYPAAERPPSAKTRNGQCQTQHVESLEQLKPRWTLSADYRVSAAWLAAGIVLIFTYTWCGMSPMKVWENRGHAKDYLFGRALTETDWAYIDDQTKRAAEIEAQGRARAFQDNKYRGIPVAEQPTLEEKFKENEILVQKFLSEMTESEKAALSHRARRNALDEKRGGYFPPEKSWMKLKGYLIALLETVAIAIWGTLLAIIFAVPASLLAARNTLSLLISGDSPFAQGLRWMCIFGVRRFLDACRGFNEFVMALIFVALIGLGPYAGILALWIHTFGILGKVFSEQIEAIEGEQVEALTSTGASVDQTIAFSVLPQVMPGFVSYSLLRFESNVRSAAILGFVGAGGIGFLIFDKLNGYLFREVCTMMIIIIISVGIIDFLCGKLRMKFI